MKIPVLRRTLMATAIATSLVAGTMIAAPAQAQFGGIVYDPSNYAQNVLTAARTLQQINNQIQQIRQLQTQIESINGMRNLGDVFNKPLLKNYIPAEAYTYLNAINTTGYDGLNATAKVLRDVGMLYNCMDRSGDARTECQAILAQPYQQKGLLQDAMKSAAQRLEQIQSLMTQINATEDQKSVLEIQARIGAENALLAHETSQIQMLQGMADSEERIARSRERERQYQMLGRTGKVSDFLP